MLAVCRNRFVDLYIVAATVNAIADTTKKPICSMGRGFIDAATLPDSLEFVGVDCVRFLMAFFDGFERLAGGELIVAFWGGDRLAGGAG